MRADCCKLFQIRKRIYSLKLTGNFSISDLHRMAPVEYSVGTQILGHRYDIGNNKEYQFKNKFEFESAYPFMVVNTILVTGFSFQEQEMEGNNNKRHLDTPVG